MNWPALFTRLWDENEGQDLVEYSLLMAFIAMVAVAVITTMEPNYLKIWNGVSNALSDALAVSG